MTTLREQTRENHILAENLRLSLAIKNSTISKEVYADFVRNQYECFKAIEDVAKAKGLLKSVPQIYRTELIKQDLDDLSDVKSEIMPSTIDYVNHIKSIQDSDVILSHIYVRHFALMFGGQIFKKIFKKLSLPYNMYIFKNRAKLIEKTRILLVGDLGGEANVCFDYVIRLFNEIADKHDIQ